MNGYNMTNIINLDDYRKKKYPLMAVDCRKELIELGYDPDDVDDVDEYWNDLFEG